MENVSEEEVPLIRSQQDKFATFTDFRKKSGFLSEKPYSRTFSRNLANSIAFLTNLLQLGGNIF